MVVNYMLGVPLIKEPALTETTAAPAVTGFHHFSPTVSDVEASAQWYERVFGMTRVPVTFPHYGTEEAGYAVLLMDPRSGIAIGLHHHEARRVVARESLLHHRVSIFFGYPAGQ